MECAGRLVLGEQAQEKEKVKSVKGPTGGGSEVQRLREENQRLKRTLADRFEVQFE